MPRQRKQPTRRALDARAILGVIDELESISELLKCMPQIRRNEQILLNAQASAEIEPFDAVDSLGSVDALSASAVWRLERALAQLATLYASKPRRSRR